MSGEFLLGGAALGEVALGEVLADETPAPTTTLLQMLNHLRFNGNTFALILVMFL